VPLESDVTPTSATLPTTKFVIGHVDTLPGYGLNIYDNVPMTPFGVYAEDFSVVPISDLQSVRFSDSYGTFAGGPIYQSITNLYVSGTANASSSGISTKFKYETFAVSGTPPIVQSIIIPEPIIFKPEVVVTITDASVSVANTLIVSYALISGTISSGISAYSSLPVSTYSASPISLLANKTFNDTANTVLGVGTNFTSDFTVGSTLLANNELFVVDGVSNSTFMTTTTTPVLPYSNVVGYKIPSSPTYTFSSVPTSINEGANGTFNITTTDVANGTSLYWTINDITTSAGDFA
jgi:hypothetical protein